MTAAPAVRRALVVFVVTVLAALAFVLYTNHRWEDYYITFRASKNLAQGHGLVFTPGERVHSFTSPLGVLLPALASWVSGGADELALWLFRLASIGALGGATVLLCRAIERTGAPRWAAWLGVGFMVCEAKVLDFTTNGMETGWLLLFLAYAAWALAGTDTRRWLHLGAAWAGIMWTRPDGFIYIGLLGGGWFLFNWFARDGRQRGTEFRTFVLAAALCTALYLPWFLWAWWYYGSPIPHTIIAKGSMNPGRTALGFLETFVLLPIKVWNGSTSVDGTLLPTYYVGGAWRAAVFVVTARALGFCAIIAWLFPRLPAPVRAASLAFHGTHAYLSYFPYFPFPWYFPATNLFAAIAWAGLAGAALPARPAWRFVRFAAIACAVWTLGFQLFLCARMAVQMEAKQRLVYDGNLRRIGEWLREHGSLRDRVFMEPLGYIGYYSQLRADDFPGLSCPRMVAVRRESNAWSVILMRLAPQWAVLRTSEAARINQENPAILSRMYEVATTFDVRPAVAAAYVPDPFMLEFDANFTLYRRRYAAIDDEDIISVHHDFGNSATTELVDGAPVRMVHANGEMIMAVPAPARSVEIEYGFLPDAYREDPKTDGAEFAVVWSDGREERELFRRRLDPHNRAEDRGVQKITVDLPESAGPVRLLLRTIAGATKTKDWTYWSKCAFH